MEVGGWMKRWMGWGKGLKDTKVKGKNTNIRVGIEDMNGIDRMIMVKLWHESKIRGFNEGERNGGRDCDHSRARMDCDSFERKCHQMDQLGWENRDWDRNCNGIRQGFI